MKKDDGSAIQSFEEAHAVAIILKTLIGWRAFPQMKKDLGELAKTFSNEQVQTLLGGSGRQEFGKTLNENYREHLPSLRFI